MDIAMKPLQQLIREKIRQLLHKLEFEKSMLYINWLFRIGALLLLAYYFLEYQTVYSPTGLAQIRAALFAFFIYNVITGFAGALNSELFLLKPVKFAQALIEIAFYTIFYLLTGNPASEVYLLYFLPLFIAVRYLGFWLALMVVGAASLGVYLALSGIAFNVGEPAIRQIFWLREMFIVGLTLVFAIRHRPSLLIDVQEDDTQLAAVLKSIEDGVYVIDHAHRLLFVNDTLQSRHGPYTRGQSCSSYFLCRDDLCGWYPPELSPFGIRSEAHTQTGEFVDRDGQRYEVSVSTCPLPDEEGTIVGAIAFVQDLDRSKKLEQHLNERVQQYAKRVEALVSTKALWLETFYDLGKRLSGFDDLQALLSFLVEETKNRLHAEGSQLFLLEGGLLRRKATCPAQAGWLDDEAYQPGEGLTGEVILPGPELKAGKPVRNNSVDKDGRAIPRYLTEYQAWLPSQQVKHLLAVPLTAREVPFGVLRVVNKVDAKGRLVNEGFSQDDEEFLEAITALAALSIENFRLLGQEKKQLQEISTLYRVSQSMARTLDWRDLLRVIVDQARIALTNADKVSVYLIDEETSSLQAEATSERVPERSGLPPIRLGEGIAGRAIQQKKLVYVPDTRLDPDYKQREKPGPLSLLVAPLIIETQVIGTLSVDSARAAAFTPDDLRLLEALATLSSNTIEKARLYKKELIRRQQAYTILQVSEAINSNLEYDRLLETVLDEVRKVVIYDSISIQLVQDGLLKVIACRGFRQRERVMSLTFPVGDDKFPNTRVLQEKKPVIIDDVQSCYMHFARESEVYQSEAIHSWMGIPLIHHAEVIGMIAFDHHLPGFYKPEVQELAQTLANQVATAIMNSQLLGEKKREVEKLNTLYRMSTVISSKIELEEVLPTIVAEATREAHSDHTGVALADENGHLFTSFESSVVGQPLHLRARSDGVTMKVLSTREPVLVADVSSASQRHNPAIIEHGFRSYAGLPVIASDRVLGVLFVHSYQPDAFASQLALLQAFCNHAAIAVEKAVLYRQARQQTIMLRKLVEASTGLIRHLDLDDLLAYSAAQAANIFDVEDGSLYLRNDERGTIDLMASSAIPTHIWPRREAHLDGPGLTAYVARTGETLNFGGDEYMQHPAWAGRHEEPFLEHLNYLPSHECRSLLISPLEDSQGKYLGVLKLENKIGERSGRRFADFEVALHKTFASHIGMAVERARFYQRLDQEARREARREIGYELHDIANFVHGALKMRLDVAREQFEHGEMEKLRQEIERITKAAGYVTASLRWIYNDLLNPNTLPERGLIKSLEKIAEYLQVPIRTQVKGRTSLPLDIEYALYKIGLEALNNIDKYAGRDTHCEITLEKSEQSFRFEVRDNGRGFDVPATLSQPDNYGLKSIQRWATTIQSRLEITSQPDRGTRIRVEGEWQEDARNG
jgi:GAF domain-containing protein/PAS domain-containing protein